MRRSSYLLYRVVAMGPTLLGVIFLIFVLSRSIQGDPAGMVAGDAADKQVLEQLRHEFQLDQPLPVQLWAYLDNLVHGNMGVSYSTKRPVFDSLMERFPATLELTLASLLRSSMLEVLGQDYIRTARSKGLGDRAVVVRHVLRNALIPVTTLAGLAFAALLGGAVLTETIFSWPGVGKYVVDAALYLDYPVIMGFTLLIAIVYMVVNLVVDLLYSWLNPQIQ